MNSNVPANNIREYDKYFSSFGRKVFGVLLKQYETGEFNKGKNLFSKNTVNRHEDSGQRRCERSNSFVLLETEKSQTIPTVDLLSGAPNIDNTAINTKLNIRKSNLTEVFNSKPVFSSNIHDKGDNCLTSHMAKNNEFLEPTNQVAWKDISDCQLLNIDTCSNIENTQKVSTTDTVCDYKVFEHRKSLTKQGGKDKDSDSKDIINGIPKKQAKVAEKKLKVNSLKRKNTKAINYWLNDVEPSHLVDGIDIQSQNSTPSAVNYLDDNETDLSQTLEIQKCYDRPKRMIQAQLINHNGIMKFSKPNCNKV